MFVNHKKFFLLSSLSTFINSFHRNPHNFYIISITYKRNNSTYLSFVKKKNYLNRCIKWNIVVLYELQTSRRFRKMSLMKLRPIVLTWVTILVGEPVNVIYFFLSPFSSNFRYQCCTNNPSGRVSSNRVQHRQGRYAQSSG